MSDTKESVEMTSMKKTEEEKKDIESGVEEQVEPLNFSSLMVVYLSVGIDMLGVSIILPVLPMLAKDYDVGSSELGFIFAAYGGAQMISMPLFGKLSDKIGRKRVTMISLTGSTIGFFFQGLSRSYMWFMFARVCAGLFGSTIPVASAYIADVTTPEERPRYLAGLSSVVALAFLIGPSIGGGLSQFTLYTPMFVSSGLALGGLFMAMIYLKESPAYLRSMNERKKKKEQEEEEKGVKEEKEQEEDASSTLIQKQIDESHGPLIYAMWCSSFLNMFAFSSYLSMFGFYILDYFNYGSLELGFISMGAGLVTIIIQMTAYNNIRLKVGKHATLIIGCLFVALGLLGIPLIKKPGFALAFVSFLAVGYGLASPSVVAILSRYASATNQGSVLGIGTSMSAFARVVGPITMGYVYEESKSLPFYIGSMCAVLNAALVFVVLVLNRRLPEHKEERRPTSPHHAPRVRLGTLDEVDREVTLWEFLIRLLTKRGILKRDLRADKSSDVEEMSRLLRRSIRPERDLQGDKDLAESLDAYTKAPLRA